MIIAKLSKNETKSKDRRTKRNVFQSKKAHHFKVNA